MASFLLISLFAACTSAKIIPIPTKHGMAFQGIEKITIPGTIDMFDEHDRLNLFPARLKHDKIHFMIRVYEHRMWEPNYGDPIGWKETILENDGFKSNGKDANVRLSFYTIADDKNERKMIMPTGERFAHMIERGDVKIGNNEKGFTLLKPIAKQQQNVQTRENILQNHGSKSEVVDVKHSSKPHAKLKKPKPNSLWSMRSENGLTKNGQEDVFKFYGEKDGMYHFRMTKTHDPFELSPEKFNELRQTGEIKVWVDQNKVVEMARRDRLARMNPENHKDKKHLYIIKKRHEEPMVKLKGPAKGSTWMMQTSNRVFRVFRVEKRDINGMYLFKLILSSDPNDRDIEFELPVETFHQFVQKKIMHRYTENPYKDLSKKYNKKPKPHIESPFQKKDKLTVPAIGSLWDMPKNDGKRDVFRVKEQSKTNGKYLFQLKKGFADSDPKTESFEFELSLQMFNTYLKRKILRQYVKNPYSMAIMDISKKEDAVRIENDDYYYDDDGEYEDEYGQYDDEMKWIESILRDLKRKERSV